MNAQRAERSIQIMSMAGIWIAFFVGWGFKVRQVGALASRGADLPAPTLLWLDLADSWVAVVIPAICTGLIIWLMRKKSIHANWVAGCLLFAGLLYGALGQTAIILPTFTMCGAV
jgi:hypothetical protein